LQLAKRAVETIVLAGGDLRNEAFYCAWEGKNWQRMLQPSEKRGYIDYSVLAAR
jgi:hypothetical protein